MTTKMVINKTSQSIAYHGAGWYKWDFEFLQWRYITSLFYDTETGKFFDKFDEGKNNINDVLGEGIYKWFNDNDIENVVLKDETE